MNEGITKRPIRLTDREQQYLKRISELVNENRKLRRTLRASTMECLFQKQKIKAQRAALRALCEFKRPDRHTAVSVNSLLRTAVEIDLAVESIATYAEKYREKLPFVTLEGHYSDRKLFTRCVEVKARTAILDLVTDIEDVLASEVMDLALAMPTDIRVHLRPLAALAGINESEMLGLSNKTTTTQPLDNGHYTPSVNGGP
jgi:hypothetical protein